MVAMSIANPILRSPKHSPSRARSGSSAMNHHHRNSATSEAEHLARARVEGQAWAKNVNGSNAWDSIILSLDGGGIRGYSELLILEELMKKIVEKEYELNERTIDINDVLPCHYFDYIWGTSTGGLIALMLGRLRMSVPQALDAYRNFGTVIFGQFRGLHMRGFNPVATRYKHQNVKAAIKQINQKHCKLNHNCIGQDLLLWPDQSNLGANNEWNICQAVCMTARAGTSGESKAQQLRSYEYFHHDSLGTPYRDTQDLDFKIWEAGRATTAAPQYFKMFRKKDKETGDLRRYKDGGIEINNPAYQAYIEVRNRYGWSGRKGHMKLRVPALLLSIGTGVKQNAAFAPVGREDKSWWRGISDRAKDRWANARHVFIKYTEGEKIHKDLLQGTVGSEYSWYRRLNVDVGLEKMKLGDWRSGNWYNPKTKQTEMHRGGATLTDMENATRAYLTRAELHADKEDYLLPSEHIEQMAECLVLHRRERRKHIKGKAERRRWHTHQGRYVTGVKMEPWDDLSCDKPFERGVEDLNVKDNTSSTDSAGSKNA